MDDDEPTRIGRTTDQLVDDARAAGTRPLPPPRDLSRPDDPDVIAQRAEQRREAWARIVPPVFGDPTIAALREGSAGQPPLPPEVVTDLDAWANDPTRNVVIMGPVGTGKTFAAWAMLRRAFGQGRSVMGLAVVDLLDALRPSAPDPDVLHRVRGVDLLLADDVGAERPTDWTAERIYSLINHRWEHARPIVATTNLDPAGLREALGDRAYSRLLDGALVIRLGADIGDRRKPR